MSDLIEEAAKAMCENEGWKWGDQEFVRNRSLRHARAVFSRLDALGYAVVPKEPTPEMVEAGYEPLGENACPSEIFRAMLAAKEGPK